MLPAPDEVMEHLEALQKPMTDEVRFAALDLVGESVVVVNDKGEILHVNAQAQLMLGYARDELVGRPVEVLVPIAAADHAKYRQSYLDNPVRRPMGSGLDLHVHHKSGRLIPVDITLNPKMWPGLGVVVGALITRKKDAGPN